MLKQRKIESYKLQCQEAVKKSSKGVTKLIPQILEIHGITSRRIKSLLNNICDMKSVVYLELGVFRGSTLIAAMYKNDIKKAYAVDNFNYDPIEPGKYNEKGWPSIRRAFNDACIRYGLSDNLVLLEKAVQEVDITEISEPVNVVFYDCWPAKTGNMVDNLKHVLGSLDSVFILIISEYSSKSTKTAATKFIEDNNLITHYTEELKTMGVRNANSWWSGIGIYVLEKAKNEEISN